MHHTACKSCVTSTIVSGEVGKKRFAVPEGNTIFLLANMLKFKVTTSRWLKKPKIGKDRNAKESKKTNQSTYKRLPHLVHFK